MYAEDIDKIDRQRLNLAHRDEIVRPNLGIVEIVTVSVVFFNSNIDVYNHVNDWNRVFIFRGEHIATI